MSAGPNGALVRRAIDEIWNQGALDAADALFTHDYVNHGGLIPDLVHGPESVKVGVALYRAAFPGLHVVVDTLVTERETVVLRWTARGARPGARSGASPAGQRGQVTGVTRVRLVDGRIAESWMRWDRAGALAQLGLIPPPEAG
jgi:ketosteroid isomerase-like protein